MDVLALITARGGSKGLPRKNILPLAGRPLIAWSIEAALASHEVKRVIVSTDDEEIAQVSRDWGAEVPFMRPPELAQDHSPHIMVIEHAIRWLEDHNTRPDYVLLLQPTCPMRSADDIDNAVQIAHDHNAVAVVSVCEMTQHPYYSKRIQDDGTLADLVVDETNFPRRQDLPAAYIVNGAIYLNQCESLLHDHTFLPRGTHAYIMPTERSMDIDSAWDFYLIDLMMKNRYVSPNV